MLLKTSCVLPVVLAAGLASPAIADTYYVPSDYATIQAAWDAIPSSGGPGWYIIVAPNTYNENLVLSGKTCWIIGQGTLGDVVIDGLSSGAVIEITNSPFDGGALLENLEITGGSGTLSGIFTFGGGLNVWSGGKVSLYGCAVHTNGAIFGGGMYIGDGSSLFAYESIIGNNQGYIGGGILSFGWTTIDESNLYSNTAFYGGNICIASDTESALITDSTLTSGRAVISGTENSSGGGAIAILDSGAVTLRNCDLFDNSADERGGAIYVADPNAYGGTRTLTINDSLFRLNDAGVSGGAVYFDNTGSMDVTGTDFEFNESSYGGSGCWIEVATYSFDSCTFSDQTMVDVGTGFRNGGAIFALDCESLTITNTSFNRNNSVYYGGALYLNASPTTLTGCVFDANDAGSWADAIDAVRYIGAPNPNTLDMVDCEILNHPDSTAVRSSSGLLTATNCTFSFNGQGFLNSGAVWIYNDNSTDPCRFTNCTFSNNWTGDRGAALLLDDCTTVIENCDFIGNTVAGPNDFRGGAVYIEDGANVTIDSSLFDNNYCDGDGGALAIGDSSTLSITACTFNDNIATEDGGGVYIASSTLSGTITGSTFEGNEADLDGGAIYNAESGTPIANCDIRDNSCVGLGGGIRAASYTTLANSTVCGNTPTQTSGNVGDLGGNTISDTCSNCPADFDGSGVVDGADLASLLGSWGPCAGCPEDLTGNGVVDGADLAIVLGSWGPCS